MTSKAQKRASAAFHAKREAQGFRKVTIWTAPATRATLDKLAKVHGSKEAVIAALLGALD